VIRFYNMPNFETKNTYSIKIKAQNDIGSTSKTMVIYISDENDVPKILTVFTNQNIENSDTIITKEVNISDADLDDLTFTVESNNTSVIRTSLDWTNYLSSTDYEDKTLTFKLHNENNATGKVKITLKLSDATADIVSKTFIVNVYASISTTFDSLEYKEVLSPTTGRIWLDRNLGASSICTSLANVNCYGYHYQFGRATDGHQIDDSGMDTSRVETLTTANNKFILDTEWLKYGVDNNGSLREASWSKTDGSIACPVGFRVPTLSEFTRELEDNNITDTYSAWSSFLHLGGSGYRKLDNRWIGVGTNTYIWTSTAVPSLSTDKAKYISIDGTRAKSGDTFKGHGMVIRCIKAINH